MMFMWMMVCLAGSVAQGHVDLVSRNLAIAIDEDDSVVTVYSTEGFPSSGIIVIQNEHIAYSKLTDTTFEGSTVRPLIRGAEGTEAVFHPTNVNGIEVQVTSVTGSMINAVGSYNIAVMQDTAGILAFVAIPFAFLALIGTFFFLPLSFLGTDLQWLMYLWAIVGVGMIVAIAMAAIGARRV